MVAGHARGELPDRQAISNGEGEVVTRAAAFPRAGRNDRARPDRVALVDADVEELMGAVWERRGR